MLKLIGECIYYNDVKVAQLVDAPSTVMGDFIDHLDLHGNEGLRDEISELEDQVSEAERRIENLENEKDEIINEIRDVLRKYDR